MIARLIAEPPIVVTASRRCRLGREHSKDNLVLLVTEGDRIYDPVSHSYSGLVNRWLFAR